MNGRTPASAPPRGNGEETAFTRQDTEFTESGHSARPGTANREPRAGCHSHSVSSVSSVVKVVAVALALLAADNRAGADDFTLPFQVPDRAVGIRLVIDFEKHAKSGSWTIAVDRLQQLLDLPTGDPVVIRAKGVVPARFEGAAVVARRIFDSLPPEGRAA